MLGSWLKQILITRYFGRLDSVALEEDALYANG